MTDRMLRYRAKRLLDGPFVRTLASVARHLGVSVKAIYRVYPSCRYRHGARPCLKAPPISVELQAFASYFGEFEPTEGVSREASTVRPDSPGV